LCSTNTPVTFSFNFTSDAFWPVSLHLSVRL
jgi:hypothetical protein